MSLIDLYLSYVAPLKGSLKYHRWAILTVIAALLERRCWVDRGRKGVIFPNMYTLLVGRAATGKSFSGDLAVNLYRSVLPEGLKAPRLAPTKITQAALYKELKDSVRPLRLDGKPVQQCPLFIYASELAVNMVDFGGGTLTNELIDFYDSKGLESISQKRTIMDDTITLHNPSVTLLGCTTEAFLADARQAALITSGLSSRIVFVVEPERVEKQRDEVAIDQDLRQTLVEGLTDIYKRFGRIALTEPAQSRLKDLADLADEACSVANSEFLENYFGRKPDHITKVAMCNAVASGRQRIELDDINLAEAWLSELEPNMTKAFGFRNVHKDNDFIQQLCRAIPYDRFIGTSELLGLFMREGKGIPMNGEYRAAVESLRASNSIEIKSDGIETAYRRLR